MNKKASLSVFFLVVVMASACGGESGGGSGASHGVASDKNVSTLSQAEINAICQDARERISARISSSITGGNIAQMTCTLSGLAGTLSGGGKAQCESIRDQCLNVYSQTPTATGAMPDAGISTSSCPSQATIAQCSGATVADIDICTSAQIAEIQKSTDQFKAAFSSVSCDNAGQPFDAAAMSSIISSITPSASAAPPPECTSLYQQCPSSSTLY